MLRSVKRLVARLPDPVQEQLRRLRVRSQLRAGNFHPGEPEYDLLDRFVSSGDLVIDVGANIGHYTARLSELVGATGRVVAFEPVPSTFRLLVANARDFAHPNVTLLQAAASDRAGLAGLVVPDFSTGLANYYEAHLGPAEGGPATLTVPLDAIIPPNRRVGLVKIDAEGHGESVLSGMSGIISRDLPTLIVETLPGREAERLSRLGYERQRLAGSPNVLLPSPRATR